MQAQLVFQKTSTENTFTDIFRSKTSTNNVQYEINSSAKHGLTKKLQTILREQAMLLI